jgi:hypothetical protein
VKGGVVRDIGAPAEAFGPERVPSTENERSIVMGRINCCLAVVGLLLIGAAIPGAAQEPAEAVQPFPLYYTMVHEVDRADVGEYMALMATFVEANSRHENPNYWATYTQMTGGPEAVFTHIYPMENLSDMDGWTAPAGILNQVLGQEEARKALRALGDVTKGQTSIVAHLPGLSNDNPEPTGKPPEYAYSMRVTVQQGRASEYGELMQKVISAHQSHPNGVHWGTGRAFIGNEGLEYIIFAGFEEFAEIDDWPMIPEVLAAAYGEEEAASIQKAFGELTEAEIHFLALVPELSNPRTPE